jgi:hypothetical protein
MSSSFTFSPYYHTQNVGKPAHHKMLKSNKNGNSFTYSEQSIRRRQASGILYRVFSQKLIEFSQVRTTVLMT